MTRKSGPDVRSGNWLFFDNHLLNVNECDPDEFARILKLGRQTILDAAVKLYEKTVSQSPEGARVHYPWIMAIKLAEYETTFDVGLTAEAQALTHDTLPNDAYSKDYIRPHLWPYLDATRDAELVPNVRGRMNGWDQAHDGLWLQVKTTDHHQTDDPVASEHESPEGSTRWPITSEVTQGIIPID